MTPRTWFARAILWLFVIVMGIGAGAGLYEALTITPLWSASPPESVAEWRDRNAASPLYAVNSTSFWIVVSPARALLAIGVLVTGLRMRGQQRLWRVIAGAASLLLFALAALWMIPISTDLFTSASAGLHPAEVVSRTQVYVSLNYLFQILGLTGFLAGMRALSLGSVAHHAHAPQNTRQTNAR